MINSSAINALCPNCNQIKQVEACVHCYQPLCNDCINHHVDQWRLNSIKYCETIDKKVEKYLTRIGIIIYIHFQSTNFIWLSINFTC